MFSVLLKIICSEMYGLGTKIHFYYIILIRRYIIGYNSKHQT